MISSFYNPGLESLDTQTASERLLLLLLLVVKLLGTATSVQDSSRNERWRNLIESTRIACSFTLAQPPEERRVEWNGLTEILVASQGEVRLVRFCMRVWLGRTLPAG